jgi:hypothetical protein
MKVVYAAIEEELKTRWQDMGAAQKVWVRGEARAAANRFVAQRPNGPTPRASNLVDEAVKRYHTR